MQTREPRKRVNWLFVIILIIALPLAVTLFFLLNTVPDTGSVKSPVDTSNIIKQDTAGDSVNYLVIPKKDTTRYDSIKK